MRQEIRSKLNERRENEIKEQLASLTSELNQEGYEVIFGEIGKKTTYALLVNGDDEIVGYTFIKDLRYKNALVGKYKALQQAVTRKSLLSKEDSPAQEKSE